MIDAVARAQRLDSLRQKMDSTGIDLAAIAPSDNMAYLLGFTPHGDERACLLLVTPIGAAFVMPSLNAEQVAAEAPDLELLRWADEEGAQAALVAAIELVAGGSAKQVAADPEMRADHLLLLQAALPDARTGSAASLLGQLREAKSVTELEALQRASDAADSAMLAAFAALRPGVTEIAVGDAVARAFAAAGGTQEFGIEIGRAHV